MKARTEAGENNPPKTPTKLCRGCFEVPIPIDTALCERCEHERRLQVYVNAVAALGESVTRDDDCAAILREVITDAKTLARE